MAGSLNQFIPATPVIAAGEMLVLIGLGLVLTVVATALPALIRLRDPLARQLAAE